MCPSFQQGARRCAVRSPARCSHPIKVAEADEPQPRLVDRAGAIEFDRAVLSNGAEPRHVVAPGESRWTGDGIDLGFRTILPNDAGQGESAKGRTARSTSWQHGPEVWSARSQGRNLGVIAESNQLRPRDRRRRPRPLGRGPGGRRAGRGDEQPGSTDSAMAGERDTHGRSLPPTPPRSNSPSLWRNPSVMLEAGKYPPRRHPIPQPRETVPITIRQPGTEGAALHNNSMRRS